MPVASSICAHYTMLGNLHIFSSNVTRSRLLCNENTVQKFKDTIVHLAVLVQLHCF